MRLARVLAPVHSLGPGERVAMWLSGCSKGCKGCISPELQSKTCENIPYIICAQAVINVANANGCDALTVSGGDPLEQADDLLLFLQSVRERFDDILVYTGFSMEDIQSGRAGTGAKECLRYIDVLIDGIYIDEKNTPDCVLRGSSNQRIFYLDEKKKSVYDSYMKAGRLVETFSHGDNTIITGIINKEG